MTVSRSPRIGTRDCRSRISRASPSPTRGHPARTHHQPGRCRGDTGHIMLAPRSARARHALVSVAAAVRRAGVLPRPTLPCNSHPARAVRGHLCAHVRATLRQRQRWRRAHSHATCPPAARSGCLLPLPGPCLEWSHQARGALRAAAQRHACDRAADDHHCLDRPHREGLRLRHS